MAFRALIAVSLWFVTALLLAGASSAPDKLNGLLDNSPFGASRSNAAAGTGTGDPLEFRSVMEEKGSRFFSIYETAAHRSTWVELNEPVNGYAIKGYDAAHENVTVEYQNKTLTLPQKRAPAVAQAVVSTAPNLGGGPQPNFPGMGATSPADTQRLQQIQEEIRRRRALRQPPGLPTPSPGAQSGPMPTPNNFSGSPPGPQLMPSSTPGVPAGPQMSPSNSSGPPPLPAKP